MAGACNNTVEGLKCVAHEWEPLPLPDELSSDKEFLKRLANLKMFDVMIDLDGRVVVKPRGYVGVFTLATSSGKPVFLIVEPKISVKTIVWMIALSSAKNFKELREIENLVSIPETAESIIDLLIVGVLRRYLEKLNEALIYGFPELPMTLVEENISVRGRIIGSTVPRLLLSGSPRLAYETIYYTEYNLITNYILDIAYQLYANASELLESLGENSSILYSTLAKYNYEPKISARPSKPSQEILSYTPLDRPYIKELLILSNIIENWLTYSKTPYPGLQEYIPALYINMNNLFEIFIRKIFMIISKKLSKELNIKIIVRKGRCKNPLVIKPVKKIYLEPDIMVEANGKLIAVGDVKYKLVKDPLKSGPKGDRDSVNQLYTYIRGCTVSRGFLIYPSYKNESIYYKYILKDGEEINIAYVHIDKTAKNFIELENSKFYTTLYSLFKELLK